MIIDKFPGIKKVALEIAYDNGFIHRDCTEEAWLESLDPVLGATGVDETDLIMLDDFCTSLSDEDVTTLAAGEFTEQVAVASRCEKPELCGLFDDIFQYDGE